MNRFIKFSLMTLTIMTMLLAGLTVYLTVFISPNTYKHLITELAKEKIQRNLEFDGDFKLTFFPRLGISIEHLSLSEFQSDHQFATVEHIHLSLLFQPLLQNKLVIDNIAISGLNVQLIRFEDNRTNIDDLLKTDDETVQFDIDIAHLRIENTTLALHDAMNKKQYLLSDLTLKTGRITNGNLDNFSLKTTGSMRNTSNHDQYDFVIILDIPNLQFINDHIASSKIQFITKATHSENQILVKFSLSNLITTAHHFNSDSMMIKMSAKNKTQTIKTHVSSTLTGDLDSEKLYLPDLKAKFNISANNLPNQLIRGSLEGNISMSNLPEHIDADLLGNIEDSAMKATFNIAGFDKPAINFNIAIDHLNTDRLKLQFSNKEAELKQTVTTQPRDKTIDFSLLSDINANGSIHIGTAQSADTTLFGMKFNIQSSKNKLNPAPILLDSAY